MWAERAQSGGRSNSREENRRREYTPAIKVKNKCILLTRTKDFIFKKTNYISSNICFKTLILKTRKLAVIYFKSILLFQFQP